MTSPTIMIKKSSSPVQIFTKLFRVPIILGMCRAHIINIWVMGPNTTEMVR
ncbi:hypothetical protein BDV32DRAFT_83226 [Aspergillus pseudonomiae]|nr:hypothetical protein BDV32DRAFT_83226 [Aspergillus pseudonomiae]